MKKPNTRTVIFSLALAASVSAYAFLNIASAQITLGEEAAIEELDYEDRLESESGAVVLPDVRLIKKAFKVGKKFLPAS